MKEAPKGNAPQKARGSNRARLPKQAIKPGTNREQRAALAAELLEAAAAVALWLLAAPE